MRRRIVRHQASIDRNAPFLYADQAEALMPSEAELMARDRTYSLMKANGQLDRDAVDRDRKAEIYRDSFTAPKDLS
ncbi:hypothetical protein ACSFA8_20815 [Variovorax sp. RT4R15]|uniref:hypothetical protein n=1 Tax=Variovorax sp. RT4R15 TaxID=3443737 RepID=UPI003F4848F1